MSSGLGAGSFEGWTSLLTCTAAPFLSLNAPEVTTSAPASMPGDDRDLVAARRAELHELLAHAGVAVPAVPFMSATTKTESP